MDTKFSSLLDEFDIASKYHSPFPTGSPAASLIISFTPIIFLPPFHFCLLPYTSHSALHSNSSLHFYPLRSFELLFYAFLSSRLGPLFSDISPVTPVHLRHFLSPLLTRLFCFFSCCDLLSVVLSLLCASLRFCSVLSAALLQL